jgi:hypothetical protein
MNDFMGFLQGSMDTSEPVYIGIETLKSCIVRPFPVELAVRFFRGAAVKAARNRIQ